jgi:steroid delta-isomerase-like uncharacterized protein
MSTSENKLIVRRFVEEVLNGKNLRVADTLVDPNAKGGFKESLTKFLILSAFPDYQVNIERIVAEGNRVAVLSTFGGTHTGPFMGIPPSGKGVQVREIDTFTVEDGKIVDILYNYDLMSLMQQIGAFPEQAVFESAQR